MTLYQKTIKISEKKEGMVQYIFIIDANANDDDELCRSAFEHITFYRLLYIIP